MDVQGLLSLVLAKYGVPIVLMMFLFEARAPRTETSSARLGPHFGLLGPGRVKNQWKAIKDDFEHGSLRRLAMFLPTCVFFANQKQHLYNVFAKLK